MLIHCDHIAFLLPTAHGDMVSDDVGYPPSSLAFAAATRPSGSLKPSSLAAFLGHGQNDYLGPVGLAPPEKRVKVPKRNLKTNSGLSPLHQSPTKWNAHKNTITNFKFIQVSRCIEGVPGGSHRHNRCHPYASLVAGVGAEPSTCPAFARFP